MKQLSNLYHAAMPVLEALRENKPPKPAQLEELEMAIKQANSFLSDTKAFSYCGELEQPHSLLKFSEIGMDLDDVVKAISGKSNNIKFSGELYLIVYPDKPTEKAA